MSKSDDPCNCEQAIGGTMTLRMLYVTLGQLRRAGQGGVWLAPQDMYMLLGELLVGLDDCWKMVKRDLEEWGQAEGLDEPVESTTRKPQ